jgi:hypothetical protein
MPGKITSRPGPRTRRFVRWTLHHGRKLWLLALLLAIPAGAATVRLYLHLNSDIEQLLPRESASVRAVDELRSRMPGLQYLGVVVDAGRHENLPAAERMLDDLAERIRAYPRDLVRAVRTGAGEEKRFLEKNAALYVDLGDLRTVRERIAERKRWEMSRKLDLALDDSPPPPLEFGDIVAKYESKANAAKATPGDRFTLPETATTVLLVEKGGFSTGADSSRALLERVRADIAALGGTARYAPGMSLGFTGDVAIGVEEISALEVDLTLASLLVVLAVIAVVLLYFRWWRAIPALFLPLVTAAMYSFALATLPPWRVTELNSNTAFLGSIIVGNGINFGIVLLARYVEARRRGESIEESLAEAVWGARLGTLVAALAAGAAYASLMLTEFRGFRQFGIIGGLGMLLCWVTSFVLTPPLLAWLDKGPETAPRPRRKAEDGRLPMQRFARFVAAHPVAVAACGIAITIASATTLPRLDASRIETNFSKLRQRNTWKTGEGYWGPKMDRVLGQYLTPTIILTDSVEDAHLVSHGLREATKHRPLGPLVSELRSLDSVLPPQQEDKIAEIEKIRRLLSPVTRAAVDPALLAKVDKLIGSEPLAPLRAEDLPSTFTTALREHDGTLGRSVLVYPALSKAIWKGEALRTFVHELRRVSAESVSVERAPRVAGTLPLSADIVSSIGRDGPLASLVAFCAVAIMVVLMFRWSASTLLVTGSLAVGVLWLVASTFLLGVKINFVNFIAFPITFGIGVDYAVNVVSRYVQDGRDDIVGPIQSTGAAVGLCSATTIIGYSSLLLAKNHGLFLFGLVAVLGELTCLLTALAVLPAVLLLWRRARGVAREALASADSGPVRISRMR